MKTIIKMQYDLPKGVELDIFDYDMERGDRQDSAFFTWYDYNHIASLEYKGRRLKIICVGEMRINYKENVIRYSDDLKQVGIENDFDLSKIEEEGGEWINNSWFEMYSPDREAEEWGVFHSTKDVVEAAGIYLLDDSLWSEPFICGDHIVPVTECGCGL